MVRRVSITRDEANDTFAEFPSDPSLTSFDHDDRKFVAVAIAAGTKRRPPILDASDSDYSHYREALERHGVVVEELCPGILKPL